MSNIFFWIKLQLLHKMGQLFVTGYKIGNLYKNLRITDWNYYNFLLIQYYKKILFFSKGKTILRYISVNQNICLIGSSVPLFQWPVRWVCPDRGKLHDTLWHWCWREMWWWQCDNCLHEWYWTCWPRLYDIWR